MKKHFLAAVILVFAIAMTGCSNAEWDYDKTDIVANYIAKQVVYNTRKDFLYKPDSAQMIQGGQEDEILEETSEVLDAVDEKMKIAMAKMASDIGMGNMVISYVQYVITDEYPMDEEALFALPAEDGYKLLVLEYELYNPTEEMFSYTSNNDYAYRIVINDGMKIRSFKNLLQNDISNLDGFTVSPGEAQKIIIVFHLKQSEIDALTDIVLQYKTGDKYIDLPAQPLN